MNIPYVMKKCTKCGRWLVANKINFHKHKGHRYGLNSICKKCKSKKNKEWREDNPEYKKRWYEANPEYNKQYRQANRDKLLEYKKQWHEANPEYNKQYYEANLEYHKQYNKQYYQSPQGQIARFNGQQRRRIKEEQQGSGITKEQWLEMMKFFEFRCAYSGETLTKDTRSIDHIVPLNSGGDNMIWNCVPMVRNLNSSKNSKDMLEWYREQSFYSEDRLTKIYEWKEYAYNKW